MLKNELCVEQNSSNSSIFYVRRSMQVPQVDRGKKITAEIGSDHSMHSANDYYNSKVFIILHDGNFTKLSEV